MRNQRGNNRENASAWRSAHRPHPSLISPRSEANHHQRSKRRPAFPAPSRRTVAVVVDVAQRHLVLPIPHHAQLPVGREEVVQEEHVPRAVHLVGFVTRLQRIRHEIAADSSQGAQPPSRGKGVLTPRCWAAGASPLDRIELMASTGPPGPSLGPRGRRHLVRRDGDGEEALAVARGAHRLLAHRLRLGVRLRWKGVAWARACRRVVCSGGSAQRVVLVRGLVVGRIRGRTGFEAPAGTGPWGEFSGRRRACRRCPVGERETGRVCEHTAGGGHGKWSGLRRPSRPLAPASRLPRPHVHWRQPGETAAREGERGDQHVGGKGSPLALPSKRVEGEEDITTFFTPCFLHASITFSVPLRARRDREVTGVAARKEVRDVAATGRRRRRTVWRLCRERFSGAGLVLRACS